MSEQNSDKHNVDRFRASLRDVIKEAREAGIPAFCIRRELRGHLAALAEGADDGTLWCVHVWGPDTVIAQPSKAVAEARAALWNEDIEPTKRDFLKRHPGSEPPLLECHVAKWPHSKKSHAKGLAEHGGEPEDIC